MRNAEFASLNWTKLSRDFMDVAIAWLGKLALKENINVLQMGSLTFEQIFIQKAHISCRMKDRKILAIFFHKKVRI